MNKLKRSQIQIACSYSNHEEVIKWKALMAETAIRYVGFSALFRPTSGTVDFPNQDSIKLTGW